MLSRVFVAVLVVLISLAQFSTSTSTSTNKRLMAWICLEFCEETSSDIAHSMAQIEERKDLFSAISFEKYTLGPNSSLVDNNLTEVSNKFVLWGLEAWPLLSSFPHPPEFIDWMRYVFVNPDPFIDSCISEAKKYRYTGYNLDWEPTDDVVSDDAQAYASFIDYFANRLHKEGLKLSVDIATWSSIWNYSLLNATAADSFISMGTYTSTDTSFTSQLDKLVTAFGPLRSGVGLETVNASSGDLLPLEEVQWRFDQITQSGASEVDLWSMPVPSSWWPIIQKYLRS